MSELRPRWRRLWHTLKAGYDASEVLDELETRYQEPHRAYHTLAHIADCLRELDAVANQVVAIAEVEFALWFHDAIYDPHAKDNEERSASLAVDVAARAGLPEPWRQRVAKLILATKQHVVKDDADAALLVDIDLGILGRATPVFDNYENQIRREYSWVSDEDFAAGRIAVLEAFLNRPTIYWTKPFQEKYEAQARANLERSVRSLRRVSKTT